MERRARISMRGERELTDRERQIYLRGRRPERRSMYNPKQSCLQ